MRNEAWWQVPVARDLFVTVTVTVQVQQEKIIRENRFQGGRKSALSGCNSHFHMYAKTQLGRCAARKSAF